MWNNQTKHAYLISKSMSRMCVFHFGTWSKFYTGQLKESHLPYRGFPPQRWFCSNEASVNSSLHVLHWNSFARHSMAAVCARASPFSENSSRQCEQMYFTESTKHGKIFIWEWSLRKRSFQMTVEIIYVIAIATPNDWLTNLAPVFSTNERRTKTKANRALYIRLFQRFEQVTNNC